MQLPDALQEAFDNGFAEGLAQGAADERIRIFAIQMLPQAVGRDALVTKLITTDLSLEQVIAILESAPIETTGGNTPTIAERSRGVPEVGRNPGPGGGPDAVSAGWAKAIKATQHDHALRNLQPLPA